MDDIATRLRDSLHRGADALPYAPDLTRSAMHRARSIQRRRRVSAVTAVIAVLVLSVPAGLALGDTVTSSEPPVADGSSEMTDPTQVTIDLETLPAGELPGIPYRQFDAYLFGGGSYDLGGLDPYEIASWDAGAALLVSDGAGQEGTLFVADGSGRPRPIAERVDSIGASADGAHLAYVSGGQLVVRDAAEEEQAAPTPTSVPVPTGAEIIEVTNEAQVLVSPEQGPALLLDRRGVESRLPADVTAWTVPGASFLLAYITRVDEVLNACSAVDDGANQVLWDSCDWTVREFSPDGTWAYAVASSTDGYGPVEVAVLDAATGDVVRTVRLAAGNGLVGTFRDAAWESDDQLLLRLEAETGAGAEVALIRLDVPAAEVELATGPVEVRPGTGDSPYLLG